MCGSYFAKNGTLFAGDNNFNLFRSDNNGSSFTLIYQFPKQYNPNSPVTGYVWSIFVDSRNYLFVSIPGTNRLYRSTNFGFAFSDVLNTNSVQNDGFYIALTEDSIGNLYAATYSNSLYPQKPSLVKSTNGGASWTTVRTFSCVHIHNVKFNPADNYLYVATGEWASGYNNQESERIFRSKDYGQTWSIVINRPVEIQSEGTTVYCAMLFSGNWVYLGSDEAFQSNWIDRFYDSGSTTSFNPQRVYSFPSDCNFPVISAAWIENTMLFSNTPEFHSGTSRIAASDDGVNWQIVKSTAVPQSAHHTNILTSNPQGIAFFSDSSTQTFSITKQTTPTPSPPPTASQTPTPTPSPTPSPTPNPTPTPTPSPTPTTTPSPIPTPTPTTTSTPIPTPTPSPIPSPTPTDTPVPTLTPIKKLVPTLAPLPTRRPLPPSPSLLQSPSPQTSSTPILPPENKTSPNNSTSLVVAPEFPNELLAITFITCLLALSFSAVVARKRKMSPLGKK